jgi:predicted MPP superfamily phosphohydrolase
VLILAIAWVLALHMLLLATSSPVIRTAKVALAGWPSGAPPLRIALLSDIHTSAPSDPPERLAAVVALVNATHPDLILLAGDLLGTSPIATRHYSVEQSIAPLAGLRAPLGVLAVPGNHDRFNHLLGRVDSALGRAGISLMINRVVRRGPLAILGYDDFSTGRQDFPGVLAQWRRLGGLPVAVTHDPYVYSLFDKDQRRGGGVAIRLAGHTHCGQISLPFWGPITSGSQAGRKYACGLVRDGGRATIVSAGIGTSILPMRLGASPDFWLVDLGPA